MWCVCTGPDVLAKYFLHNQDCAQSTQNKKKKLSSSSIIKGNRNRRFCVYQ